MRPRALIDETIRLLGLLLHPNKSRPDAIYSLLGEHNNLGSRTRYLNLGYWKNASTYDDACEQLALEVGRAAGLGAGDDVLDVGCGFGEQDALWREHFAPRSLTALNLSVLQLAASRRADGVRPIAATATALPFHDASFDKVLCLESAFHFVTRERFFDEAARVLRPGGRLVIADPIARKRPSALALFFARALWQFPAENLYPLDLYLDKLRARGFVIERTEDLSEHVFAPFSRYAATRVEDPEIRERVHPLLRAIWGRRSRNERMLDYVLVVTQRL